MGHRDLRALQRAAFTRWAQRHHHTPLPSPALPEPLADGWRLVAPSSPAEVEEWGRHLRNCLGAAHAWEISLGSRVLLGVATCRGAAPAGVLDVTGGRIRMFLGPGNHLPSVDVACAAMQLLKVSPLLDDVARARMVPAGLLHALLGTVGRQLAPGVPGLGIEAVTAVLWACGVLPHSRAPAGDALEQLATNGLSTPPHPLPTAQAIMECLDDQAVRGRLADLRRGSVSDEAQLALPVDGS